MPHQHFFHLAPLLHTRASKFANISGLTKSNQQSTASVVEGKMSSFYFLSFFNKPCCQFPSNTAFLWIFLPRQALGTPLIETSGKKQPAEPEFGEPQPEAAAPAPKEGVSWLPSPPLLQHPTF